MIATKYTKEQIIQVYNLRQEGKTYHEIEKIVGLKQNTSPHICERMDQVLNGATRTTNKEYIKAAKIIKQSGTAQTNTTETPNTPTDHFSRFKKANDSFNAEIESFIESEVSRRVQQVEKQLTDAQKTIERLNQENDKYQRVINELKDANWVDTLKRKWNA